MDILKENCRFCVKYVENSLRIKLNNKIQDEFQEATNLQIDFSEFSQFYSDFICKKCQDDLATCLLIKRTFIEGQNKLMKMCKEFVQENQITVGPEIVQVPEIVQDFSSVASGIHNSVIVQSYNAEGNYTESVVSSFRNQYQYIKEEAQESIASPEILETQYIKEETPENINEEIPETQHIESAIKEEPEVSAGTSVIVFPDYLEDSWGAYSSFSNTSAPKAQRKKQSNAPCPHCGIPVSPNSLQSHINIVHLKIKNFMCDYCNQGFYLKTSLRDHLVNHVQIEEFTCLECEQVFSSRDAMQSHIKDVHKGIEIQGYVAKHDPNKKFKLIDDPLEESTSVRLDKPSQDSCFRTITRTKRMKGESYLGYSKKRGDDKVVRVERPAKQLGPRCNTNKCGKLNCKNFTDEERLGLFKMFCDLDWLSKAKFVKQHTTKRQYQKEDGSLSRQRIFYLLPKENEPLEVCQVFFRSTLGIGVGTVRGMVRENVEKLYDAPKAPKHKPVDPRITQLIQWLNEILYTNPTYKSRAKFFQEYLSHCEQNSLRPLKRTSFYMIVAEQRIDNLFKNKSHSSKSIAFK